MCRSALICQLTVSGARSTAAPRHLGVINAMAQDVSVEQLLAHPETLDGKNVRAIGVAAIDPAFAGISELHADQAAYRRVTSSRIGKGEFAAPMGPIPNFWRLYPVTTR